ncbi:uncharacterized protein V1510DRAFT_412206 [Dipodascopsis tothii]|uniref:uncharacterized protein n=1 Tax=Dipodascopsis tothii TaxID=44089 RepID=UPI0034CEEF65
MVRQFFVENPYLIVDSKLSEGPVYVPEANQLYCVDILNNDIIRANVPPTEVRQLQPAEGAEGAGSEYIEEYGPASAEAAGVRRFHFNHPIGVIARTTDPHTFVLGAKLGPAVVDFAALDADQQVRAAAEEVVKIPYKSYMYPDSAHLRELMRLNDGNVDPQGRFWAGTMIQDIDNHESERIGALFRFAPGTLEPTAVLEGCAIPNGLLWTKDGTQAYFADSIKETVVRYDYDAEAGTLANPVEIVRISGGPRPDGLTLASNGDLFLAVWGAGCVNRYTADGELIEQYHFPAKFTNCPVFGGPEHSDLFVTTANKPNGQPQGTQAGQIFRIRIPGLTGPVYNKVPL